MPDIARDACPARLLNNSNRMRWFLGSALAMITVQGCHVGMQSKPTPYDGMMKQLHAGMTYDSVMARLGKPYLPEYNVGNHVSALYQVDGTILPLIVRFQKVESLVIHDPAAQVDSWCAYIRVKGPGDSSVLVFAPTTMNTAEQARWISGRADGFPFPGRPIIREADPDRPQGSEGEIKLVEAQSVHNVSNTAQDGSSQIAMMDALNLRLVCHPVF